MDDQRLRVSIAMATYNGERFIREQLDSFAAQTRLPDELAVCDDGSTDATIEVVREFAATAPFHVRLECNSTNLGSNENFSKAVSMCSGDWIFFSDQDDRWHSEKISRVLECFKDGIHVVTNDCMITDEHENPWNTKLSNVRSLGLPDEALESGCCTAFTHHFAELAFPVPPEVAYDTWTCFLGDRLRLRAILAEPLQIYRRHGRNLSNASISWRKPTWWKLAVRYGLKNPVEAWMRRCLFLDCCKDRILKRRQIAAKLAGADNVMLALDELATERQAYRMRTKILSSSRTQRLSEVLQMWRSGGYGYFGSWKSAAKDILRP
ncbi:MAG TPA: glycosyltransferase [Sphingomicrobium sp.]|nr:glycosyltransferase [Sphingomicrobium sp.]